MVFGHLFARSFREDMYSLGATVQQTMNGSPRALEARARGEHVLGTSDFVHYVIHFAAVREGRSCEMCRRTERIDHTHYFEPLRSDSAAD